MAPPRTEYTVKEFATQERVTPRTVWNWIAKGAIPVRRTPGGGIRVVIVSASTLKNEENHGNPSA